MKQDIVSVIVVTYNSSKTVLHTLESVRCQTYKQIELIVSDDCSKDETVDICLNWIKNNGERFVSCILLQTDTNTGVTSNCNRALERVNGKWIKLIAGDDLLMSNCVEDYLSLMKDNKCEIAYSLVWKFFETPDGRITFLEPHPSSFFTKRFNNKSATEQLRTYTKYVHYNITPSLFYSTELIKSLGGFDEKYKMFEDSPFIVKVLKHGISIGYLPKISVLYRVGAISITSQRQSAAFFNRKFSDDVIAFTKEEVCPCYKWYDLSFWLPQKSRELLYLFTVKVLNNKRSKFRMLIYELFRFINPVLLYEYLRNRVVDKSRNKQIVFDNAFEAINQINVK